MDSQLNDVPFGALSGKGTFVHLCLGEVEMSHEIFMEIKHLEQGYVDQWSKYVRLDNFLILISSFMEQEAW